MNNNNCGCNRKDKTCGCQPGSVHNPTVYNKTHSDEWNLLHKRNKFELWVDKYNHTLEFIRTVVQVLVFILQIIILWRLFI